MVHEHPLFSVPAHHTWLRSVHGGQGPRPPLGRGGWGALDAEGTLWFDPERKGGSPEEWAWVCAVMLTHLGFRHLPVRSPHGVWIAAADAVAGAFVDALRVGRRPEDLPPSELPSTRSAEALFERWVVSGVPPELVNRGIAGHDAWDLVPGEPPSWRKERLDEAAHAFEVGLAEAVHNALVVASGRQVQKQTPAHEARSWFVSSFPLLGALAASFDIVYDVVACRSLDIRIAAIDPGAQVVYLNPAADLSTEELRFVVAHELLHAGLRHDLRRQGRDPFLWNVACDYVINGWLQEMAVGHMPTAGVLYDPELQGLSAEAVYDRIANDLRRVRKLCTLRGQGLGDIIEAPPAWWSADGCDLDAFYRRCLATGLDLHTSTGRGYLPAGLIQEIEALAHPPVPWDVELAQWFDRYFAPLERYRSFAHPSRRQSSTPDLPRPRYVLREDALAGRTFGVVLDTSGSMEPALLAKALGAIASYAIAREVPAARVIFCDAHPYDQGFLPVEAIASRVKVRGRGGTVLQPGIDLLERAEDFPADGPVLIITDAECDVLHIRREHAFLLPQSGRLPFTPRGPVFRVEP
jgi:predicted metal-dependent peptidase